jgi:predicted ArsR family transcriptional regulator
MADAAWRREFFETTRGQIVQHLCAGAKTVADFAQLLAISENAVRSHLDALERDGFVHQTGKRPGTRKPHFSFELTPKARELFRKGYEPVLLELLDVLSDHQSPEQLGALALEVGRRLVQDYLPKLNKLKPASRLKTLASKSCDAGIPLRLTQQNGEVVVCGCSCPLSAVIRRKPELCDVVAQLLSEILQQPVEQCCEHGESPRCQFRTKREGLSQRAAPRK